ncbi:MAG: YraN family protein [bacterium]|nr:YraN family protein [bacterium]
MDKLLSSSEKGKEGEKTACNYLLRKGYSILFCNYFSRYGEIDIVSRDVDKVLVFCEVKTYKAGSMIDPLEAVNARKMSKIVKTAEKYLIEHGLNEVESRFDILIVRNCLVLKHLQNVFSSNY